MEPFKFPELRATARSGAEIFAEAGGDLGFTLMDFWQWMGSDLLNNAMRGVLAEFIVARALGRVGGVRIAWDAHDLETSDGVRVEVKSAAYCQTWGQHRLSDIKFDIAPKWPDNIPANDRVDQARRPADVYVFCVLHHRDKASIDPMLLEQWTFHVLSARVLDARMPLQKSIRLSALLKLCPVKSNFGELRENVWRAAATTESTGTVGTVAGKSSH